MKTWEIKWLSFPPNFSFHLQISSLISETMRNFSIIYSRMPGKLEDICVYVFYVHIGTSWERPKSALYLRLKIVKGGPFGLCETPAGCKVWKKLKGSPLGTSQKKFKMRSLNSVTVPKNVKGGTLWDFLTSIVLQDVETNEGGPFGAIQKVSKTSHSAEKKWGYGRILSMISRFWTFVLFLLFVLDALLRFELLKFEFVEVWRCWTNEQKKDLARLKKTTHCKSRALYATKIFYYFLLKCTD